MPKKRKAKIDVYKKPAVQARKGEPMPLGRGWRLVNIKGTRKQRNLATSFQSTLLSTFDADGKRFAVFEIRDWPAPPQSN